MSATELHHYQMGAAEATVEPDVRALDGVLTTSSPTNKSHKDHENVSDPQSSTPPSAQQLPVSSQQTPMQSNMPQQPSQYGQPIPFDMTSVSNNLPPGGHRHQYPNQYNHAHSQPYSPTTSPPVSHPMPPMHQYGGHHLAMPNPSYYVQQTQMPQYYPGTTLPPAQGQPGVHGRPSMVYYPNQMIMNQPHPGFYYPQDNQYSNQPNAVSVQGNIMAGQYTPVPPAKGEGYDTRYMTGAAGRQNQSQGILKNKS